MTKIIGILNLTLDSFSDGGMYYDLDSAKKHISDMINQGADVMASAIRHFWLRLGCLTKPTDRYLKSRNKKGELPPLSI